jgi:hypothetical protein
MKSIKYFALAYLLSGTVNMQAMGPSSFRTNEESCSVVRTKEASPFETHAAQIQRNIATQLSQLETVLVQEAQSAYDKDMQLLVSSLGSTDQDRNIEFYRTKFYTIGNTVYSVFAKRPDYSGNYSESSCSRLSALSPESVDPHLEIEKQDFYKAEFAKGNRTKLIGELPILRGPLAEILLVRAAFAAQLRNNNNTPDDIRREVVANYIQYSKTNRGYVVSQNPWVTEPISDGRLNEELATLNGIPLTCTFQNVTESVATKIAAIAPQATVGNIAQHLLKKACVNHYKASIEALAKQSHRNYENTLYKGV